MEIFEKLYEMTAISNMFEYPAYLLMYLIAFLFLYLGIKKGYEPLLLIPIAFGILLANFPGGKMEVIQATEANGMMHKTLLEIAHDDGIMNFIYYALIKTGVLPPIIFMGVGALTDFGPLLRNLRLAIFGAAAHAGIFSALRDEGVGGVRPREGGCLGMSV